MSVDETYDLEMLAQFLELMISFLMKEKTHDDLVPFFCKYPNIIEVVERLYNDLGQHQTVRDITIQKILNCSDDEVSKFIKYFIEHEFIVKLEHQDLYFVNKDNISGMKILLITIMDVLDLKKKLDL